MEKDLKRTQNIANNIKRLIEKNGMTQKQLSEAIGISPSTMSDYMNLRTNPSHGVIQRISDYFGVSKSDIDESYKPSNIIDIKPVKNVPIISEVACGNPIFSEDNYDDSIPYSVDLLPSGNSFFVRAQGYSMSPTIEDRELVLVREQPEVENGEVACVIFYDDEATATLKRVRKVDGTVILEPDNRDYESYLLKKEDETRILGKAVFVINEL